MLRGSVHSPASAVHGEPNSWQISPGDESGRGGDNGSTPDRHDRGGYLSDGFWAPKLGSGSSYSRIPPSHLLYTVHGPSRYIHARGRGWEPPPRSLAVDAHDCIMGSDRCDPPNTKLWRLCRHARQAPLRSPLRANRRSAPAQTQTRRYSNARTIMTSLPGNDSAELEPVQDAARRCPASGASWTGSARGAPPESRSGRRGGRKPSNKGMPIEKYPLDSKSPIQRRHGPLSTRLISQT